MRLFIALEVPEDISHILIAIQKLLPASAKKTRSFHLTLKFLGEVESWEGIRDKLESVLFRTFKVQLDAVGAFPDEKNPRVVWTGIREHGKLNNLKERIDNALPEYHDNKKFHPHLTLARMKRPEKINFEKINSAFQKGINRDFKVDKFALYRSTLTPTGPVYEALKEYHAKDF